MKFLVAPTERPPVSQLGKSDSLPEQTGSDIIWTGVNGIAGCQRKELHDLIASVRDNRLGRELQQMAAAKLAYRFLVVEGQPQWDRQGNLVSRTRWSIAQHNGVLLSVQLAGVMVLTSRNALETCTTVEYLYEWTQKKEHASSLLARGKPPTDGWGRTDDRTTFIHAFSFVPGISTEMAGRIFDALGNIMTVTVGRDELKTVSGLGPKRIDSIMKVFGVEAVEHKRAGDE